METLTKDVIEASCKAKGYKWFEDELNIVGIRTNDKQTNIFNDILTFSYKDKVTGEWQFFGVEATTDPGLFWLKNPGRVKGTGILVPGQYIKIWKWAMGHNGYKQFLQLGGPVKAYRDNNRDNYLDMDPKTIETGYFGMNGHRAHPTVVQSVVEKYSAMCQVVRNGVKAWSRVEKLAEETCVQDFYSYTLLTENEII